MTTFERKKERKKEVELQNRLTAFFIGQLTLQSVSFEVSRVWAASQLEHKGYKSLGEAIKAVKSEQRKQQCTYAYVRM